MSSHAVLFQKTGKAQQQSFDFCADKDGLTPDDDIAASAAQHNSAFL
jgi:hypothetical protein